jgi:hypothetical protein
VLSSYVCFRPIADIRPPRHADIMKVFYCALSLASALVVAIPANAAVDRTCGLSTIDSARELNRLLSLRAVEVVQRASQPNVGGDAEQEAVVAPSATFSLGAGDVGRPLGTGINGARALARAMNADTYRFLGWDYMDGPANACAKHKVEVEFVDSRAKSLSRVEFTFDAGRLVSAAGWSHSFEAGLLASR